MVTIGNGIPVTCQRFMEEKSWHVSQGKYREKHEGRKFSLCNQQLQPIIFFKGSVKKNCRATPGSYP
jgi:hypothetical protein